MTKKHDFVVCLCKTTDDDDVRLMQMTEKDDFVVCLCKTTDDGRRMPGADDGKGRLCGLSV